MKTLRVIAIDPGQRVGWATGVIDPVAPSLAIKEQGVDPLKEFALRLNDGIGNFDIVVIEKWVLFKQYAMKLVGSDMQSSQLIGMLRFICWQNDIVPEFQSTRIKEVAMGTMPDYIKERMSLSTEQHDKDALMHLWYYFFKNHV